MGWRGIWPETIGLDHGLVALTAQIHNATRKAQFTVDRLTSGDAGQIQFLVCRLNVVERDRAQAPAFVLAAWAPVYGAHDATTIAT